MAKVNSRITRINNDTLSVENILYDKDDNEVVVSKSGIIRDYTNQKLTALEKEKALWESYKNDAGLIDAKIDKIQLEIDRLNGYIVLMDKTVVEII